MPVTILPYGDRALLLELVAAGVDVDVHAGASAQVSAAIRAAGPRVTAGLVDIVPAERTVLVTTRPGTDLVAL
ncbi:MAG: allophanate hydrolase, partial [Candidatus Lutibacillus vidarii]